ncbi:hypothetical protein [Clostridium sp. D53t1_180928_C8]|uniref:hypothetical protein n=1 Tax=Clostridium sp. D53t1_180928_C8 TaxID=2787101 RepID=UPI0018AAB538|nr:hypothetical protein [Clostridium sp. D53t1_180928_C8]
MKKLALSLSIILGISFVGCTSNTAELKSKIEDLESQVVSLQDEIKTKDELIGILQADNKNDEEIKSESSKEYLSAGEVFNVKSELGDYEFKIVEAKYLGPHEGDSNNFERVQVVWEVNNISFNGWEEDGDGNKVDEGFCQVPAQVLRVKDDENYVLDQMSSGWEGDFSNFDKKVYIGEKIIQKYTWILNDKDTENLYISFSRMEDKEYKIKINR